jgi:hypothetical protein
VAVARKTEHNYFKTYTAGMLAKWQPYMDNEPLSFTKIRQGFQQSNFTPLYYLQTIIETKYINLIPDISYGGLPVLGNREALSFGLALAKEKKHTFILGSQHLENLLNGDKIKAVSLYLKIKLNF